MVKYIGLILLFFFQEAAALQMPASLDFNNVSVGDSLSLKLTISGEEKEFIHSIYCSSDVFYSEVSVIEKESNESIELNIWFKPEQNIEYKAYLVLLSGLSGKFYKVRLIGNGKFSSYYSSTFNKWDEDLEDALEALLGNATSLGYNGARDEMYADIDNNNGQVECVYTAKKATFSTRQGANQNSFNCEHTFPQGFFNSNNPMKSDIHHLFPTDVSANSTRGNKAFGTVNNPTWQQGGSKSDNSTFEPRDSHKGSAARAMIYFYLRYGDYSNFFKSQEAILRQWHKQFSPALKERNRNQDIFELQQNRNPLVDYPQFLDRMIDLAGSSNRVWLEDLVIADSIYTNTTQKELKVTIPIANNSYGTSQIQSVTINSNDISVDYEPTSVEEMGLDSIVLNISFTSDMLETNLNIETVDELYTVPLRFYSNSTTHVIDRSEREFEFVNPFCELNDLSIPQNYQYSWRTISGKEIEINDAPDGLYILMISTKTGAEKNFYKLIKNCR